MQAVTPPVDLGPNATDLVAALLVWYDRHRRVLPWRALPGERADPYRVWLSEIMLQQTTVAAVPPYFARFLARFPAVGDLAAAPQQAVLQQWAGLGYYARARNLHACARAVTAMGGFPRDAAGLRTLPGIGPYTATAIAAIAFDQPGIPIDGNVERVLARLRAIETPLPQGKPAIAAAAATLEAAAGAQARPSDTAQALFDLGATICTPANPACTLCPWRDPCAARALGLQTTLPRKRRKPPRPIRYGAHFYLEDPQGRTLLRRRPPSGLLGGMSELPGTAWREAAWAADEALAEAPQAAEWRFAGQVRHVFTHFELRLDIYAARSPAIADAALHEEAAGPDQAALHEEAALPSLMRKCVALGRACSQPAATETQQ